MELDISNIPLFTASIIEDKQLFVRLKPFNVDKTQIDSLQVEIIPNTRIPDTLLDNPMHG